MGHSFGNKSFPLMAYAVLPPVSRSYPPPKGMFPYVPHPSATAVLLQPFNLHVLGLPPAFVLSQDQTLRKINYFIRKPDSKHLNLCCFDYIGKPMSQIEFSRLHRTIQFSISWHPFVCRSYKISHLCRFVKRKFEIFLIFYQLSFQCRFGTVANVET